jgi:hypothetical protein
MAAKTPPLHVLRGILRRLRVKSELETNNNSATRNYIMEKYRASQSISCQEAVEELRKMAFEYYSLKQDLTERTRLHQIDTGAEKKLSPMEMSRRAAAKAGLQLPDLDPDLEKY